MLPKRPSFEQTSQWRGRLPVAAELLLVSLLALQVARLAWLALTPLGPIGTAAPATAVPHPAPSSLPQVDVFFRSAAAPTAGGGEALGYTLFGVRREGDGGSAILGKDGDQASHAVGRQIAPGIVLESVGAEHAVLAANGVRHRLELPRLAAGGSPSRAPAALPVSATKPRQTPAPTPTAPAPASAAGTPATPLQPPTPAGLAARPDGGYAITAGTGAALLRPAGLRPGDVVLSVNGRPLDPARLAGLQDELKGQTQLSIQYRRDGKTHTTTLQAPR